MEEISSFLNVSGVIGAVFHRGKSIVHSEFPKFYSPTAIEEMCEAIATSFTAYSQVGRVITEEILYFSEGTLLILTAPPKEGLKQRGPGELISSPFLTFLLENQSAGTRLLAPARAFLQHQTRVDVEAWQAYEEELNKLLGKIINRTQCEKLISRVLKSFAPDQQNGLPRDKFLAFGQALVREVPNRGKHDSLNMAIDKILIKIQSI
jgi:hypothetical protein